jgi:hypothetical protein
MHESGNGECSARCPLGFDPTEWGETRGHLLALHGKLAEHQEALAFLAEVPGHVKALRVIASETRDQVENLSQDLRAQAARIDGAAEREVVALRSALSMRLTVDENHRAASRGFGRGIIVAIIGAIAGSSATMVAQAARSSGAPQSVGVSHQGALAPTGSATQTSTK